MATTEAYFDSIFDNTKANAIMIMDDRGIIERVNGAFTSAYGYSTGDLEEKHFRILYIEKDQLTRRPEIELNTAHREGSSTDENYLVHKNGTHIWVTGESIVVKTREVSRIIKIIHNIHAQKQLERYLLRTSELLDSLFESVQNISLLIIDSRLKVIKMNEQFKQLFGVTEIITEGSKLQQIPHPFWSTDEIKNDLRSVIINTTPLNKDYILEGGHPGFQRLHITSKTLVGDDGGDKRVLLVIKEE